MSRKFNVLSYNVFTPVSETIRQFGQNARASRIAFVVQELDHRHNIDAIIFNEIIAVETQSRIYKDMDHIGFRYWTDNLRSPLTVPGGTVIFSKWPITMEKQTIFGDKCDGIDCFAAKGVNYARILKMHEYYNVFGVHMQAWSTVAAQLTREAQIQQIQQFIQSLNIQAHEPVLFGGDLNMDLYMHKDHLDHLMHKLHLSLPEITPESHRFTVDSKVNRLVGLDEPSKYKTQEYPEGCLSEYYQTLSCICCDPQFIDYVLFSTQHQQPLIAKMTSIPFKVPSFNIRLSLTREISLQDVSDHFPLLGEFIFPPLNKEQRALSRPLLTESGNVDSSNASTLGLSITVVILVAILLGILVFWIVWTVTRKTNAFHVHDQKKRDKNK